MYIYVIWGFDLHTGTIIKPFTSYVKEEDAKEYCKVIKNGVAYYYDKVWLNNE